MRIAYIAALLVATAILCWVPYCLMLQAPHPWGPEWETLKLLGNISVFFGMGYSMLGAWTLFKWYLAGYVVYCAIIPFLFRNLATAQELAAAPLHQKLKCAGVATFGIVAVFAIWWVFGQMKLAPIDLSFISTQLMSAIATVGIIAGSVSLTLGVLMDPNFDQPA